MTQLSSLFLDLTAVSAAVWGGTIAGFSGVVAPVVFRVLDGASARAFLRTVFPRYYRLGVGASAVMAAAAGLALATSGASATGVATLAAAIILLALSVYSLRLVPQINAASDAGAAALSRFNTLHRRSVLLNAASLVLALGAVVLARQVLPAGA